MKIFTTLMLNSLLCLLYVGSVAAEQKESNSNAQPQASLQDSLDWSNYHQDWMDDVQFHGFMSQGLFHSSGNNVYGSSRDGVSAGSTEVGLNVIYQPLNNLHFAAQGLYQRAGAITGNAGEFSLDFAFIDFSFLNFESGNVGVRGGRIKHPWGLYNETRDVAFTHPTIFLPLLYFERSRKVMLSMNGGQVYTNYNTDFGNINFKFSYGMVNADSRNLLLAITNNPLVPGRLKAKPSFVTQLSYELMEGRYIVAVSYADVNMGYTSDITFDPYAALDVNMRPLNFSAQYNGEKFNLTSEYTLRWNSFSGARSVQTDAAPISQYWYVQAGYRVLDNLMFTLRYDDMVQNTSDPRGHIFHHLTGLPAHITFAQDIVLGVRWDITPSWMLRMEYHQVHGAASISLIDNPEVNNLALDWNIYAMQLAYRF